MGTWLEGPKLTHANGYDVVSDGLVPGCIQVPGSGQPVALLMDCQTIGGFPKLATIISADLPRFAQCRPGSIVRFAAVDVAEAQNLYRDHRAFVTALPQAVETLALLSGRPFWLLPA
jgi:allophanate hydrolase subunit 2